jgi:hypothetical protein
VHPEIIANCPEIEHFSLVRGGFLYTSRVRLKLAADPGFLSRQVVASIVITWLPVLILAALQGLALGHGIKIPFLQDYSTNIRLLITLPLLIVAESTVDPHIREAVHHFVTSGLVTADQIPAFQDILRHTLRLRDSMVVTIFLVLIAFGPSLLNAGEMLGPVEQSSWHFVTSASGGQRIAWAGLWFAFISIPIYRILLFRWLWLLIVWTIFLWRVTHIRLNCIATHPDRAGGLGFLSHVSVFFGPVIFAASSALAGAMANKMAYEGSTLTSLQFVMIGACVLAVSFAVAPLIVVSPSLIRVKQRGILEYSSLGNQYATEFEKKWIEGDRDAKEELLGSGDIQSLADLGNSFGTVHDMKVFLIDHEILLKLAIPAVLPMLVLIAVATPAEEILKALFRLLA